MKLFYLIMFFTFSLEQVTASNSLFSVSSMVLNEQPILVSLQNYLSENLLVIMMISLLLVLIGMLLYKQFKLSRIQSSSCSWQQFSKMVTLLFKDKKMDLYLCDGIQSCLYKYNNGEFINSETIAEHKARVHPEDKSIAEAAEVRLLTEDHLTTEFRFLDQETGEYIHCEFVMAVGERDSSGNPVKIYISQTDSSRLNEIILNQQALINELNLSLETGQLIRWSYDLLLHKNRVLDDLGGVHAFDNSLFEYISKADRFSFLRYILSLVKGIENKSYIDLQVYSVYHKADRYYRLRATIQKDKNDNPLKIHGVWYDITDDVEYREMLEKKVTTIEEYSNDLLHILDYLPIPIALRNLEDGLYTYSNAVARNKYAVYEGELPSYKILKTTLDGDVDEIRASGKYEAEEKLLLSNGKTLETSVRSIPIRYKSVKHALISREDLTEYNAAKHDSKLLSNFMPPLKAYSWTFSTETNMFAMQHNKILERYFNGELTPQEFLAFVHPEDRKLFVDRLGGIASITEGISGSFQFRMDIERKGNYEWWETNHAVEIKIEKGVKYILISGITINIDQKKRSELELIKLNKDIELILNNANSLLAYVTSDYEIIWSNANTALNGRLEELYKAGVKCCLGYGCLTRGHEGTCESCPIRTTLASGDVSDKEFLVEEGVWFKTTAVPIPYSEGMPNGVILKIDDVSEYKKLIQDLEITKAKAEESDKLKSAFLANMSHEIRTPLNAIVGFSELLQTSIEDDEKEEYIRIINSNNDLLLRLIGDILDLSKIESGLVELHTEPFDFSSFFNDAYVTLSPRCAKSEVTLNYYNPYDKIIVNLDKNRMLQIVTNYLNNAVKFTQRGEILMGYSYKNGGLEIFIKDTGIGIAKEKMKLLFQRFEKLDHFAQGTGLGLSICKAIAERMGGRVWAESEEGKGSAFFVFVPCEADIKMKSSNVFNEEMLLTDTSEDSFLNRMKNILVVEDNNSNYLLVKNLLKDCHVTRAFNGAEAVAYIRQFKYDVVLMDLKMPVMGGIEATKKIREFDKETVIIAVTANALDSDKTLAVQSGCNAFISKPIRKVDLESIIFGW
ncbi:MAG: ATP-binding protein [Phocaeicola sp.]